MTTPANLSSCRSCHAAITFAISPKGARLPLDAKQLRGHTADDKGGVKDRVLGYRLEPGLGDLPQAVSLGWMRVSDAGGVLFYSSHFATCPNAAAHSRRAQR